MEGSRLAAMRVRMQGELGGRAGSRRYEVVAISAGEGNGLHYSPGVLEAALPLFEGVVVFVDHSQLGERWSETGGRSVRNVLGVLENVGYTSPPAPLLNERERCGEGGGTAPPRGGAGTRPPAPLLNEREHCGEGGGGAVRGELRVYPGPDAEWFCAMVDQYLVDRSEGRASPRIGLSAVLDVSAQGREVAAIEKVVSVDAVYDPARGGEFVRALNQQAVQGRGYRVESSLAGKQRESTETSSEGGESAHSAGGAQMADEEVAGRESRVAGEALSEAMETQVDREGERRGCSSRERETMRPDEVVAETRGGRPAAAAPGATVPEDLAVAVSGTLLEARLGRCQLPAGLQELVVARFGGRVFDVKELDREMEALQSAWAEAVASSGSRVTGCGATIPPTHSRQTDAGAFGLYKGGIAGVVSEVDRMQAVMDKLVGLQPKSELLQGVRPVGGIRELYLMLTGDYDFRGVFDGERVALANVTTSTMTSLVKNAFNKVILDYFNTIDRWWEPIVAQESFGSMQDLTLITLGGFADLPTVAEGAAYTELSWSDSEEVVSFVKKGGYVGVTLEMMDKDETRAFRAIPRKLAIAGYRTLSSMISTLWTANSGVGAYWPASQATYRLFDASYGNLGTSALSAANWDAVIQAMYKMTEATSGERMGIRPAYLVVPIELEKTALTIMESMGEPDTADNDANVRRQSARVVVCPEMTDTNDWLAVADPRVWPAITVAYRFGSVPEVFIADQETVGSMFTNDEMRIKARYIVAVGVGDYRPLYKCNVT